MTEAEEWNASADHPMQSFEWGEFRAQTGNKVSRIRGENQYQIIWSKVKFFPWWFGYIPMSPMPSRKDLKLILQAAIAEKAIGVRMEPKTTASQLGSEQKAVAAKLAKGRHLFKPDTYWWDLTKSEEELMAKMHPKCRYNIRLATKHGVAIAQDNTSIGLNNYLHLMFGNTLKRQRIYSHSETYHRKMWSALQQQGIARLFTARHQEKIVAVWMIFIWKEFLYYAYGGFDDTSRQIMAPVKGLWEIAKWGKSKGLKYFDLWGSEEGKGFSRFKEQFGAEKMSMIGTFDLAVNQIVYPVFRLGEEIRWKILRSIR